MVLGQILCDMTRDSWNLASYLRELAYRGMLEEYLPEIKRCYAFEQHNGHHAHDVFEHTMASISHIDNSMFYVAKLGISTNMDPQEYKLVLRVTLLLHDIGKPYCFAMRDGRGTFYGHDKQSESISRFILKRSQIYNGKYDDSILLLIRNHMRLMDSFDSKDATIKRMITDVGKEYIPYLIGITYCDLMGGGIPDVARLEVGKLTKLAIKMVSLVSEQTPSEQPSLCINGKDIADLGFKGKEIGQMLKILHDRVYTASLANNREDLLNFASRYIKNIM